MTNTYSRSVLVSSGAMVGRVNNYDYKSAVRAIASIYDTGSIAGGEMMMINPYYERIGEVTDEYLSSGVPYPVIHCEKDIGEYLSVWSTGGKTDKSLADKALSLFKINCETGAKLGSGKMVLHLWGGAASDGAVDGNIEYLAEMTETAKEYGLSLLVENVPCTTNTPLENWRRIVRAVSDARFIFDCRFGAFHHETDAIFSSELGGRIEHIHVSDFVGFDGTHERDFKRLRPIPHPLEGKVDFVSLARDVDKIGYNGYFTIESPVMSEVGLDTEKMKKTVLTTKRIFNIK